MKTTPTQTLYKKVGRKYVPVEAYWHEQHDVDRLTVGSFRLTYAYADGGKRYEYDVQPDTAGFVAAALIAKHAMCEAITEASRMRPSGQIPYTKKQLALIAQFRKDMGGMMPVWWTENDGYAIADAAIEAVKGFKP